LNPFNTIGSVCISTAARCFQEMVVRKTDKYTANIFMRLPTTGSRLGTPLHSVCSWMCTCFAL